MRHYSYWPAATQLHGVQHKYYLHGIAESKESGHMDLYSLQQFLLPKYQQAVSGSLFFYEWFFRYNLEADLGPNTLLLWQTVSAGFLHEHLPILLPEAGAKHLPSCIGFSTPFSINDTQRQKESHWFVADVDFLWFHKQPKRLWPTLPRLIDLGGICPNYLPENDLPRIHTGKSLRETL